MKVKRRLLGSCLFLVAALARAQAGANPQVLQVFDQVCLADVERTCFDSVFPAQYTTTALPTALGTTNCTGVNDNKPAISQYYTRAAGSTTCTRPPLTSLPQVFAPVLQVCEMDARIHRSDAGNACVRDVPVAQLVHTLDVDLQKLLVEFCQTYAADPSKCKDTIKPVAAQGQ
ncbi:hypothetical protein [Paraburkholderia phenoliruptrix]|uniref:hypothetical protein n=1 Tax=Paraburkholderia phenoliruptrix TaxID=252970 RepID=UPI0034CD8044